MSFETKYLIRWGIPGWVFIFWLFFYFSFTQNNYSEFVKNVPLLISLIVAGVPLGYLIYQIYFVFFWSIRTKDSLNKFKTSLETNFLQTQPLVLSTRIEITITTILSTCGILCCWNRMRGSGLIWRGDIDIC